MGLGRQTTMKLARILLTTLIVFRVFVAAADQTYTVSTLATWNGTSVFGQMGENPSVPGTVATYGQTFTAPTNTPTLRSFSFYMEDSPVFNPDPLNFGTYIMAWNGRRAVGPVLWKGRVAS